MLALYGPAEAQSILRLDFNDRSGNPLTDTQPGFTSFLINSNLSPVVPQTNATVRTYGALTVSLWGHGINPSYVDYGRAEPTNQGAFTESLLLRDFVQSSSHLDNGGLNLLITGLASNQVYGVTIWSFDPVAGGRRVSDWYANEELMVDNYTFDGRVPPTSNASYRFTFYPRTDATGRLLIVARRDVTSVGTGGFPEYGVFLNALQIEPALRISSVRARNGSLVMTVDSPQPAQLHHIDASSSLWPGSWTEVGNASISNPSNNVLTITVPGLLGNGRMFRVRY